MISKDDLNEMEMLKQAYLNKKEEIDREKEKLSKIQSIEDLNVRIKQVIDTPPGKHDEMMLIYSGCHCDGIKRGDLKFNVPRESYVNFLTSVYFEHLAMIDELIDNYKK